MQVGSYFCSKVVGSCEGGSGVEATEFFFQRGQLVGLFWVGLAPFGRDIRLVLKVDGGGEIRSRARRYSASVISEP